MKRWGPILIAGLLLGAAAHATQVGLIKIDGAIGPATANYISRAIDVAAAQKDECLIIQLNTPGGLITSMEDIKQKFYASPIPVVVFVFPSGAAATSAGTFITMAADIAAMAPNTRIGAAHPVGFVGVDDTNSVMSTKIENDIATSIINIAEKRGRNAKWAESAVRQSKSITSEEALKIKVIDLIATNVPDLLLKLNGKKMNDKPLHTAGASVVEIPMSAGEKFFQLFWQPEVMMLLMLIAIYGIIAEMSHPGAIFPGVAGALALILLLYMSATLPLNIAGLALIVLAIALFIIDIFAPTHGVLTGGGIIAFFLGALMLFNHEPAGYRLPMTWVISTTLVTAAFFVLFVSKGIRAQFLPKRAGMETMIGKTVNALSRIDSTGGKVFIEGENWNAMSETTIESGQPVEIVGIDGLTLKVQPKTH
ncbi:MAG TPA: nodulation protein NfeD [Verrucomicrobiae bacterium]|nr:nodulation protein NfeD [Verrucomicrobiae bacterium]